MSTAQWPQVDRQVLLQTARFDAEGADGCCLGADQSFFAAPHTPRKWLLSHMGRVDETVGGLRPSRRIAGKNRRGLMAKLIDRERASERVAILGGDGFGDRESIHLNVLKCWIRRRLANGPSPHAAAQARHGRAQRARERKGREALRASTA